MTDTTQRLLAAEALLHEIVASGSCNADDLYARISAHLATPMSTPLIRTTSNLTIEGLLEAMARNYADGHCWDHLDGEAVKVAAAELRRLRLKVGALDKFLDAVRALKVSEDMK